MVETILTNEMIEMGKVFVRKLDEHGMHPDAVLWLYFSEAERWKLVVAETEVGTLGPKKIYQKIREIMAQSGNELFDLSLDDVTLSRPDEPIIALLRTAIQTGPGISGIRFKNNAINGTLIEDAYIYRMN
jgi:hypothetical protein